MQLFRNNFLTELIGLWWKILNYAKLFFTWMQFFQINESCWKLQNHDKQKFLLLCHIGPGNTNFFARLIISSEFVSFDGFDCFIEQASFHSPPKSPQFQRLILLRIFWSRFCLCFCPPLLLARKKHLDNPMSFLQLSSVLEISIQSVRTSEKNSDHLYRILIRTQRTVGSLLCSNVFISGRLPSVLVLSEFKPANAKST